MTSSAATLAAPEEIHAYLLDQLDLALRRSGMYAGETTVRLLLDCLLFVEQRPGVWAGEQRAPEARGVWSQIGVPGAFHGLLPSDHGCSMASVYAEFTRRRDWLTGSRWTGC